MTRTPKGRLLPVWGAFLIAAGVWPIAGCGGREEPAPTPASMGTTRPGIDAQALLSGRCTVCHGIAKVEAHRADRAGWQKTVDKMIEKGAKLNPAERDAVVNFLAQRDGGGAS